LALLFLGILVPPGEGGCPGRKLETSPEVSKIMGKLREKKIGIILKFTLENPYSGGFGDTCRWSRY
jgi:hypothetical protein